MQGGFIYTTDLGYRDEDGYIYCLGRQDFVINLHHVHLPERRSRKPVVGIRRKRAIHEREGNLLRELPR